MNYARIYDEFISDRQGKPCPNGYSEKHHILPKALGGLDRANNLIRLTPEDHYFAHLLLAKAYGGKMWNALYAMCHLSGDSTGRDKGKLRSRATFGHVKRSLAEHFRSTSTGRRHTDSAKNRVREALVGNKRFLGRSHTQETILKMSASQKGRTFSSESIDLMRAAHSGKVATVSTREKMSLTRRLKGPSVGFKGVHKHRDKWTAKIEVDKVPKHLGVFSTEVDAARSYDAAAIKAWGIGNCYLNFPEEH